MQIRIEFDKPVGTTREDIAEFVMDALSSWGGQFHPEDPLFESLRGKMKFMVVGHKKFICEDYKNG